MAWIDDAAEKVARGAKWLDDELPGWFHKIDLDSLNMEAGQAPANQAQNMGGCVLCQLDDLMFREGSEADWLHAASEIANRYISFTELSEKGFAIPIPEIIAGHWGTLDNLWKQEIRERLYGVA